MKKIRIAVLGAGGRMGKRILSLAAEDLDFQIVGAMEAEDSDILGKDVGELIGKSQVGVKVVDIEDLDSALSRAEVLIDFTHPKATEYYVHAAAQHRVNMVIGTTGLSDSTHEVIKKSSKRIAILQTPNMSAGVNSLFELVSHAAKLLKGYDAEITEIHHNLKKDAPSGTALELARFIAEVRGLDPKKSLIYGRHGETGERKKDSIALHALRGGDVVGEHTVYFFGNGEVIELTHRATSRDAFARGALLAAKFVARKKKGLYNMRDVLQA
jgi:4-hydroxy-tetrahydrodipicolinate reductase